MLFFYNLILSYTLTKVCESKPYDSLNGSSLTSTIRFRHTKDLTLANLKATIIYCPYGTVLFY
jgi:hypothetical protein